MNVRRQGWKPQWGMALLVFVPAALVLLSSCQNHNLPAQPIVQEEVIEPDVFEDVTAASGIKHTYDNGEEFNHLSILESLGGGAGVLDYDGDGLLDVFLTGGGFYDGPDKKQIKGYPNKLYKNLGNLQFKDVSAETRVNQTLFYNHGCAVADFDNDGWPDIVITGWDRLVLLHNEPDGKGGRHFVDVAQKAGLTSKLWSAAAGWADFDGDGLVDLYVVNYVDWSFDNDPFCTYDGKQRDVCPPKKFKALPDIVYRNNGNGTFTDVSKSAGLRVHREPGEYPPLKKDLKEEALARYLKGGRPPAEAEKEAERSAEEAIQVLRDADDPKDPAFGKGLGITIVDINNDCKPDLYIGNDTVDNFLYVNRSRPGKILFEEMGLAAGVSRDDRGSPNGSMGSDAGDPLGTGRPALWQCNYESELHGLYINECRGDRIMFRYGTQAMGLAAIGQVYVSWGTQFVDFDLDGWEDLFVSSGHAIRYPGGKSQGPRPAMAPRRMLPMLLMNRQDPNGRRRFKESIARGGSYFKTGHLGRGVAFGDLNNDGRGDMVLNNMNDPTVVLKNVLDNGNHWLGVDLKRQGHRNPVGARIILEAGGRKQYRWAKGGTSWSSACDPRCVFGLETCAKVDSVTVVWPTGKEQTWKGLACDRYWPLPEAEN